MACPGGACGKDGLELRMLLYGALAALLAVGVLWIEGYRLTAYALLAIPVLMAVAGPQLSRGLDRVCSVATKTWRTHARRPGRRYCPECACALRAPKEPRPVSGDACPKCEGGWCESRELLRWLAPYGTNEGTWRAIARDELSPPMLCPKCAVPLETGSLDRLQPFFARCGPCGGYWLSRMTWTWFALTPPSPAQAVRAPSPSPLPELALRKSPAT